MDAPGAAAIATTFDTNVMVHTRTCVAIVWGVRQAARMSIGRELRRRRQVLGLTLEELAHRAGLTPHYVSSVERDQRDPSISTVLALAEGIRVPPSALLGGAERGAPSATALEAARLFDRAPMEIQNAVLAILTAVSRPRAGERARDVSKSAKRRR